MVCRRAGARLSPPRRRPQVRRQRHARVSRHEPERPHPRPARRRRRADLGDRRDPALSRARNTATTGSGRATRRRARKSTNGRNGRRSTSDDFTGGVFWPVVRTRGEGSQRSGAGDCASDARSSVRIAEDNSPATPFSAARFSRWPTSSSAISSIAISTSRSRAPSARAARLLRPALRAPRLSRARHGLLRRVAGLVARIVRPAIGETRIARRPPRSP